MVKKRQTVTAAQFYHAKAQEDEILAAKAEIEAKEEAARAKMAAAVEVSRPVPCSQPQTQSLPPP